MSAKKTPAKAAKPAAKGGAKPAAKAAPAKAAKPAAKAPAKAIPAKALAKPSPTARPTAASAYKAPAKPVKGAPGKASIPAAPVKGAKPGQPGKPAVADDEDAAPVPVPHDTPPAGRPSLCLIEIVKDGHFFIARTDTASGAKEYKNTVFEDLLTEMLITLQEQLIDK